MTSFSDNLRPRVLFVTFPNAKLLDIAGPLQVFADAKHHGGARYDTAIAALGGGAAMTDAGVALGCLDLSECSGTPIDTLLIAGGAGAQDAAANPSFCAVIRALAGQSRRIGSVCTGAFVLAAAGLLTGRQAVTHWQSCTDLAAHHPEVTVIPDRIYVQDGAVWTSAGVTAGIDMALAMVAQDAGRTVALRLARSLVAFMARPGGQSQFSEALHRQTDDTTGRFDGLHDWIMANLAQDLRVERLADRMGMSARNFARAYRRETGHTPAKAVEQYRVAEARRRLEESDESVSGIARATGFIDDERLRRAMQRVLGTSPQAYRERFGRERAERRPSA